MSEPMVYNGEASWIYAFPAASPDANAFLLCKRCKAREDFPDFPSDDDPDFISRFVSIHENCPPRLKDTEAQDV